jgi:hypothetical protein
MEATDHPAGRLWHGCFRGRHAATCQFLFLFTIAFSVRAVYIGATTLHQTTPWEAANAGISLARQGEFGNVFAADSGPSAHVAPVFPFVLAAVIHLCGSWDLASSVMRLLAAISASATIALLPQISEAIGWKRRTGGGAALILIVLPLHWRNETISIWEAPFAALVFALLLLAILRLGCGTKGAHSEGLKFGALLGLSGLLSPPVCLAGISAFLAALATNHQKRAHLMRTAPVAFGVFGLILLPWIVRNAYVLGGFVPLRSNLGLELCIGNADGADGNYRSTIHRFSPISNARMLCEYRESGELAFMRRRQAEGLTWIGRNPAEFLKLCAIRARAVWFGSPDEWRGRQSARAWKCTANAIVSVLSFGGLFWLFICRSPFRFVATAAVLTFPAVYLVTHVDQRYVYPIFWLNVLLAAGFVSGILRMLSTLTANGTLGNHASFNTARAQEAASA